jgi:hypothetical protein
VTAETAAPLADPAALARDAARRRQAITVLRIAASIAGYAAAQLGELDPDEARQATMYAALELERTAEILRRLVIAAVTDPQRAEAARRRALAAELAGQDVPLAEIAGRLGISQETARGYLRSRSPAGR